MRGFRIFPAWTFLVIIGAGLSSCEKAFLRQNPNTDPEAIFEEYTTLVKEKYAMLEFKGVDIDQLTDSLRSTIEADMDDAALFEQLAIITDRLRDGHSVLIGDQEDMEYIFDLEAGFAPGFDRDILFNNYIGSAVNPGITLVGENEGRFDVLYGTLPQAPEIGYLWVPSWDISLSEEQIDQIIGDLQSTDGLIVDMRQNTGGDPALSSRFAARFIDAGYYAGFERFKIGPDPDDFSDSPIDFAPSESNVRYLKSVIILTDRLVYSATTTFLYLLDPVGNRIQTMGQRSGGGSGSVADGFLANGWYYSLSVSEFIDARDRNLDDGVEPDIAVALDLTDPTQDEVIERAILELQ